MLPLRFIATLFAIDFSIAMMPSCRYDDIFADFAAAIAIRLILR